MNRLKLKALCFCILLSTAGFCQVEKRKIAIKRINTAIKIDGVIDEAVWKTAPLADKFVELRPTPFRKESEENRTEVYFLYDNEGIYVGGYLHEKSKDSIAKELSGRDGFGNNDFIGVVFDTYNDKLNGFEYFVTPLNEQWDAKSSNGGNEDFSWNAVWQSAVKLQPDGWSFEMFLPYSCIRFGKKKVQDWGLNIVRKRQKSGQQSFWQTIDPNVSNFLSQEGKLTDLENIKPPLRLQLSPYMSTYINHDGTVPEGVKKNTASINGGMDVKYGINQAFTLDMTLIPDFGQVQTDNKFLNLSPFEQKFSENRPFFTEGTELFNKGNLFYSRRIGVDPRYKKWASPAANDTIIEDPSQAKIINATKISGRTQKGLGVGILNAITEPQFTKLLDKTTGQTHHEESMPLTNYNILVLDQTLKHNSSISLVNTNVWRSGNDYDANVTSALFDFNNKKNVWNVGGNVSFSNIIGSDKTVTGYAHSIYFGKTSGRFNFTVFQDLYNDKYDKSDLGYFTNNNAMGQGFWAAYRWTKPKHWYNQMQINFNGWWDRLVSPIDILRRRSMMFQDIGWNVNANAQTKKLRWFGFAFNRNSDYNDFYEPRSYGRVFHNQGSVNLNLWYQSNTAKKYSWTGTVNIGEGGVFTRKSYEFNITAKARLSSKLSIDYSVDVSHAVNQPGWADTYYTGSAAEDSIYFSRRDVNSVENILSVKYSFTNRMGITVRTRHYWSKVDPKQFYQLDTYGNLQTPSTPYTGNANQNYNFLSVDMAYNWQFAQGSFFSIVWKDFGESFDQRFQKNYAKNLTNTINGQQSNSLSFKVIYFIDYLTAKRRLTTKRPA